MEAKLIETIIRGSLWVTYFLSLYFAVFWFLVYYAKLNHQERKKELKIFGKVTIAIPAYNEEDSIEITAKSACSLDYPNLEVIVVDDGSKDNTAKIVKKLMKKYSNLSLIQQSNRGKGAALNNALDNATGEYFVVFDADSEIKKDALRKMLPYFSNKNVAVVLPVLKVRRPKNYLQKMQWFEYLINMFFKELMSKLNCVHVAPGPFSVYRTSILRKVGKFDEDNLTEDLEMAFRLQKHDYRLIQLLDVDVTTIAPENVKQLYKQRNRWYKGAILNAWNYKSMFFNKKYGDFSFIQMPTVILSGIIALVMIFSIIYFAFKPYIIFFHNMYFVDFDFITVIKNLTFNIHILDYNFAVLAIGVAMFVVSLFIIKKSHVYTREKVFRHGFWSIFVYMNFYFLLLGTMWIGIAVDLVRRKKQKW